MHLRHYTQPRYQLYICRILLIVPLYAVQSTISLWYIPFAPIFDTVRDIYEGWVIYMFFTLLTAYLGGEDCLVDYLELKSHMSHPGLLQRCCGRITLGRKFLRRVRQGTLQFVLIRPTTAVLALLLNSMGLYDKGNWSLASGYVYLAVINNISVSISLYSLVLFYRATEVRLRAFRPLPKFLSIKAIVFFSYWQGFVLSVLVQAEILRGDNPIVEESPQARSLALISAQTKATLLQDMMICVEIFIASLVLSSAFSYRDFTDDVKARRPLLANLAEVLDPQDLAHDAHSTFIQPQGQQSLGPRNLELHSRDDHGGFGVPTSTYYRKGAGGNGSGKGLLDSHIEEF